MKLQELASLMNISKKELIEQLKEIIRNITIKHQKHIPKISYDIDLFDDYLNETSDKSYMPNKILHTE